MKTIVLALLLLLCGCIPPGAYPLLNTYPGGVGTQQFADNYQRMMQQQALDRQNLLMQQQNMILQQRGYR